MCVCVCERERESACCVVWECMGLGGQRGGVVHAQPSSSIDMGQLIMPYRALALDVTAAG